MCPTVPSQVEFLFCLLTECQSKVWWHPPVILALRRREDHFELKASLEYIATKINKKS